MALMQTDTFGFELLQKLYTNDVAKKEDVIVLFVHWHLLRCGFKCVGLGDSRVLDPSEKGSELLPNDWSKNANYALRYIKEEKLYILHGTKSDEDLLFNFLRIEDRNVTNIQCPIGTTVTQLQGPLETVIPGYQGLLKIIQNDLIGPMLPNSTNESGTQTAPDQERQRRQDPDAVPLRAAHLFLNTDRHGRRPDVDPANLGRADLDPFAHPGAGGMLFDPFSARRRFPVDPLRPGGIGIPGRLPPGAIVPGARFDPFGPPDPSPFPGFMRPGSDDII